MPSRRDTRSWPHACPTSASIPRKAFGRWTILAVTLAAIVGLSILEPHRQGPETRDVSTTDQIVRLTGGPTTYPNAAFIGDSYTLGQGASVPQRRWTTLVSQKLGWTEHNFGRGATGYLRPSPWGPNYMGMLDEVVASDPDIVVVAGGQNDKQVFLSDSGPVSAAITATYNTLRARLPNARIIAIGPSVPGDITPFVIELDSDVQIAARAVGAEYVSLIAPTAVLQPDMLSSAFPGHPNDVGYAAIADRITSILAPN
jgi:lysophospholipase L1-like esterase